MLAGIERKKCKNRPKYCPSAKTCGETPLDFAAKYSWALIDLSLCSTNEVLHKIRGTLLTFGVLNQLTAEVSCSSQLGFQVSLLATVTFPSLK
jgi:hypothetical protein